MISVSFHHVACILCSAEKGVVAGAVGDRLGVELERVGRGDAGRRRGLSLAREDGDDHVAAGDAGLQRLGADGLHGGHAMIGDGGELLTNWRSPSAWLRSLSRTFARLAGRTPQSLNGAPLRNAPGLRNRTGR